MDEKLLTALIAKLTASGVNYANLPAALAKEMTALQEIKRKLNCIRQQAMGEADRHEAAMVKLKAEAEAVRDTCPHLTRTYHGDPSGGSDSSETCDFCNREFR